MKVIIYDRKTRKGTLDFYLAAFLDEKVIALKHVDLCFTPDLKKEDVAQDLERFAQTFKEELSETMGVEVAEGGAVPETEKRKRRSRQEQ